VFGLALPGPTAVRLAPGEHVAFAWLPWREAAAKCFSWSNRDAIRLLAETAVIA
jgi:dATP pyrophosphohydrolase